MTAMTTPLPGAETPLYSHPLPQIEQWLRGQGCHQDSEELNLWRLQTEEWKAELWLEVEELAVLYVNAGEGQQDIKRTFKYSLSRQDIENAVFSGP
ncbi:MAG: DUF3143 domain-containing protein [Thermosynechococcaceae cyanobacterium]